MAISPSNIRILFTTYDIITYFLNLASWSEHFISIKHRILATFNINKKKSIWATVCQEHSHCEDADPDVIPNESSTEKVKKWEQKKSSIFQNNFDIDKRNLIISKLENVDQQNVNQNSRYRYWASTIRFG
jgi:hypothetical protein